MQLIHKVATLLRAAVRGFLALAALWLAGNGAWILILGHGAAAVHLAELCALCTVLSSAAWHWLGALERSHETIMARHRTFVKTPLRSPRPALVRKKPVTAHPTAPVRMRAGLVPQVG